MMRCEFKVIDRLYSFLQGEYMLRRQPMPDLRKLLKAERACWMKIHVLQHEGVALPDGIDQMIKNQLFWWDQVFPSD